MSPAPPYAPKAQTALKDAPVAGAGLAATLAPPVSSSHAPVATVRPSSGDPAVVLIPNVIAAKHWDRLLGGPLYAATTRIDWATLLRRTFDVDVLRCASCGGRLRIVGEVTDPAAVRLVLEVYGLPTDAPHVARARDPTELLGRPGAD
jgi:hypothetical protein